MKREPREVTEKELRAYLDTGKGNIQRGDYVFMNGLKLEVDGIMPASPPPTPQKTQWVFVKNAWNVETVMPEVRSDEPLKNDMSCLQIVSN